MIYVFDTNSLGMIANFFPERFPSFWKKFDQYVSEGKIISVREVYNEIEGTKKPHFAKWLKENKSIFSVPSPEETEFVNQIFSIPHFQNLISQKSRLQGKPVADPFIIAAAKIKNACVVTEESFKENAAKIPNVCNHFGIEWTNLEGFMEKEGWTF